MTNELYGRKRDYMLERMIDKVTNHYNHSDVEELQYQLEGLQGTLNLMTDLLEHHDVIAEYSIRERLYTLAAGMVVELDKLQEDLL